MGPHPRSTNVRRALVLSLALAASAGTASAQDAPVPPAEARQSAVQRGVDFLLAHQQRDGTWGYEGLRYPSGQTALSAYTLLKAGVPAGHAAIRRALAYIEAELPRETYAQGCELVFLEALRDPAHSERMRALVERLLASRLEGEWGYPLTHSDPVWIERVGRADLSNTQYAVLGLRAAAHSGIEVPRKVWYEIFDRTLEYQEPVRAVDSERVLGRKVTGRFDAAGFRYTRDGSREASGSMTAAGLTVLGCVREVLGDQLGTRRARQVDEAFELGTRWLASRWSVEANPGEASWQKYYLYGLERMGSLYATDEFQGRRWFDEGSALLLQSQAENGSWGDSFPDTCFAMLFLLRATSPVSGDSSKAPPDTYASPEGQSLRMFGVGQPAITLWLGAPEAGLRAEHPEGLFVERVEYLVDGEVVAQVDADPSRPWGDQSFPARHEFKQRGTQRVAARVQLAPAGRDPERPAALAAEGFEVVVRYPLEPWMLEFAGARTRNLLRGVAVTATSSSEVTPGEGPAAALDGRQESRWLVGEGDELPWLRLELPRKIKVGAIVFSQATPREYYREYLSRFARAELFLNGDRKPLQVQFEVDELRPTRLLLDPPRAIDRLELRLTERTPGTAWPWLVGLSEIAFEAP